MADLKPLVSIIMGSDSDLPIMKKTVAVLNEFEIVYEMRVISAHRNSMEAFEYAQNAHKRGIKVIVAGAGLAAHLPGVLAGNTPLPIIGVPCKGGALNGLDALYSIVQMPPGVPVATVGIDAAKNAGLLAVQILSTGDEKLVGKMLDFKKKMADESRAKNNAPDFT